MQQNTPVLLKIRPVKIVETLSFDSLKRQKLILQMSRQNKFMFSISQLHWTVQLLANQIRQLCGFGMETFWELLMDKNSIMINGLFLSPEAVS